MTSNYKPSFNVICDNCNGNITIDRKSVKVKRLDDLEAEYFICPHCKEIYLASVTDTALRLAIKRFGKGGTESIVEREKWLRDKHREEIIDKIKGLTEPIDI